MLGVFWSTYHRKGKTGVYRKRNIECGSCNIVYICLNDCCKKVSCYSKQWGEGWRCIKRMNPKLGAALARLLPGYIHTIYPLSILSTTRTCTIPRQLPRWWSPRRKSVKSTLTFSAFNAFVFIYLYSWCAASITWDDDSWALIVKPHHSCLWTICNRASSEPSLSLKLYNHKEHLRHF